MMVRTIAGVLSLLALSTLTQPVSAQNEKPHVWDADRPDARAPMSITVDRMLPAGAFEVGFRYLYTDNSGQGYRTDSLTVNQVLGLFDVAPSEMTTQGFAVDFLWGATEYLTVAATGTFAQKTMDHLAPLDGQSNAFLFYQTQASGLQDLKVSALYDVLSRGDRLFIYGVSRYHPAGLDIKYDGRCLACGHGNMRA